MGQWEGIACMESRNLRLMEERALREGWGLTPEQRRRIIDRLMAIVDDEDVGPSTAVKATGKLIQAHGQDVAAVLAMRRMESEAAPSHVVMEVIKDDADARRTRLLAIAKRLGIDVGALADGPGEGVGPGAEPRGDSD